MRKRRFLYWSAAFGALTVVVLMNYYCYRAAMGKYTQLSRSYREEIAGAVQKEVSKQVEVKFEDLSEGLPVANTEEMLSVNTVYQIENYDKVKDQTTTEYETIPEELVGFNREEADGYFKKYMQNLPVEEFLNGLQSIGITTFSKDRIIVRKIYDPSKVKYRYYLIAVDGEVVVYYGDQKTVYEYTGISTDTLSKEEQMSLKNGIEVKDEEPYMAYWKIILHKSSHKRNREDEDAKHTLYLWREAVRPEWLQRLRLQSWALMLP